MSEITEIQQLMIKEASIKYVKDNAQFIPFGQDEAVKDDFISGCLEVLLNIEKYKNK